MPNAVKQTLPQLAGEDWPHPGHRAPTDPRLMEFLANLERVRHDPDSDPSVLLWILSAGMWWLKEEEANLLADELSWLLKKRSVTHA